MANCNILIVTIVHEGEDNWCSNCGVDDGTSDVGSGSTVSMSSDGDDVGDVVGTEGGPLGAVLHAVGMQEGGHGELAQPWSHGLRTSQLSIRCAVSSLDRPKLEIMREKRCWLVLRFSVFRSMAALRVGFALGSACICGCVL